MEHLGQRHPILIKIMTSSVDDKTLVTLKKVSRGLYEFLEEERFYWLRVIQSYYETNIYHRKYKSWKKLVDKTPSEMIKKLALALHQFIHLRSTPCQKQWPPGTVSERMSYEQSAIFQTYMPRIWKKYNFPKHISTKISLLFSKV